MKQVNVLKITWVDSLVNPGWQPRIDCVGEIVKCQTVGFLVDETDEFYCLAFNRGISEGIRPYGELITIPKVSVTLVEILDFSQAKPIGCIDKEEI